ncbi:unnamed protein product [Dovyalis caffra]|uniref:Uncharacterized protein n=1 Tax=Dovyalis caffra TaxID=77055 RepID=A0AAV1SQB8_9ROSI|nr:unnamed protein product [Dovyalis caffra]
MGDSYSGNFPNDQPSPFMNGYRSGTNLIKVRPPQAVCAATSDRTLYCADGCGISEAFLGCLLMWPDVSSSMCT